MALSDRWTRLQLRTAVRRELQDSAGRWWTDDELNQYLDDWQNALQERFEFVWGTSTITTSTSTLTHTTHFPSALRIDRLYWNNVRLPIRTVEDMNSLDPYWRESPSASPFVGIAESRTVTRLHPAPSTNGTLVGEYPTTLTLADDLSVMEVPAWTKYSAIPYCTYRAYLRFGPNQSPHQAVRRKARWLRALADYQQVWDSYLPSRAPVLRPQATQYDANILSPRPFGGVTVPSVVTLRTNDEVPTGTINGTNLTFTLTYAPDPTTSLKLFLDGVLLTQGSHYTLSSTTITFVEPYQPQTGMTLFASYRYTN